jgi:hypothetical protein
VSADPAEYGPAHQPDRPSWECPACGRPWPCTPAWEVLREQVLSAALGMYMVAMVNLAAGDMPGAEPGQLYARFIEPTGQRPGGAPTNGARPP